MIGINIQKCYYGTARGGLVNKSNSGSWGNRGKGNEFQSILENGLDLIGNLGTYAEDWLSYLGGLLPGGLTADEAVANTRLERMVPEGQYYYDIEGNLKMKPIIGVAPTLPTLPNSASPGLIDIHNRLKKARWNWQIREGQLRKVNQADQIINTRTAKKYYDIESEYKNALEASKVPMKKYIDDTKLTKKQTAAFKAEKARATGDGRATNSGRSRIRAKQWDYVEEIMRKDPKAAGVINRYDLKIAKGRDPKLVREYRKKMLTDYINKVNGFEWLKNK